MARGLCLWLPTQTQSCAPLQAPARTHPGRKKSEPRQHWWSWRASSIKRATSWLLGVHCKCIKLGCGIKLIFRGDVTSHNKLWSPNSLNYDCWKNMTNWCSTSWYSIPLNTNNNTTPYIYIKKENIYSKRLPKPNLVPHFSWSIRVLLPSVPRSFWQTASDGSSTLELNSGYPEFWTGSILLMTVGLLLTLGVVRSYVMMRLMWRLKGGYWIRLNVYNRFIYFAAHKFLGAIFVSCYPRFQTDMYKSLQKKLRLRKPPQEGGNSMWMERITGSVWGCDAMNCKLGHGRPVFAWIFIYLLFFWGGGGDGGVEKWVGLLRGAGGGVGVWGDVAHVDACGIGVGMCMLGVFKWMCGLNCRFGGARSKGHAGGWSGEVSFGDWRWYIGFDVGGGIKVFWSMLWMDVWK